MKFISIIRSKPFAIIKLAIVLLYVSRVLIATEMTTGVRTMLLVFGFMMLVDTIDSAARAWK